MSRLRAESVHPETPAVWLIEEVAFAHFPPRYWDNHGKTMTQNVNAAVRFATREDAERVLNRVYPGEQDHIHAIEHLWVGDDDLVPAPLNSVPVSDESRRLVEALIVGIQDLEYASHTHSDELGNNLLKSADLKAALLAHIASIEADREKAWALVNFGLEENERDCDEKAALRAELQEARKDTARLDFLSDPNHRPQFDGHRVQKDRRWTIFGLKHIPHGATLREAIDAAGIDTGKERT